MENSVLVKKPPLIIDKTGEAGYWKKMLYDDINDLSL